MRLGVTLGGGFARGLAHIGVLGVLKQNGIPLHFITGVSARATRPAAHA
jgi:NTE family protein